MKYRNILTLVLAVMFFCVTNTNAAEQQNEQLKQADEYIYRLTRQLEDYYKHQFLEVEYRTQSQLKLLGVADKPVNAALSSQTTVAQIVLMMNDYGYFRSDTFETARRKFLRNRNYDYDTTDSFINDLKLIPERYTVAQTKITEKVNDILAKHNNAVLELERQKEFVLNIALPRLHKRMIEGKLNTKPKAGSGVITGIVYSHDKPLAIIDGQILHEQDTIQGVKILNIHKDKVEFARNGNNWNQRVQQQADSYWQ